MHYIFMYISNNTNSMCVTLIMYILVAYIEAIEVELDRIEYIWSQLLT